MVTEMKRWLFTEFCNLIFIFSIPTLKASLIDCSVFVKWNVTVKRPSVLFQQPLSVYTACSAEMNFLRMCSSVWKTIIKRPLSLDSLLREFVIFSAWVNRFNSPFPPFAHSAVGRAAGCYGSFRCTLLFGCGIADRKRGFLLAVRWLVMRCLSFFFFF